MRGAKESADLPSEKRFTTTKALSEHSVTVQRKAFMVFMPRKFLRNWMPPRRNLGMRDSINN